MLWRRELLTFENILSWDYWNIFIKNDSFNRIDSRVKLFLLPKT